MLTYPWKCTVLYCNHLGNTWKPLVLMTRHFDYCPSASEGDNQSVRSSAPVVSRCFPGGYNVKLYISRGRLAWWLLAFLCCGFSPTHIYTWPAAWLISYWLLPIQVLTRLSIAQLQWCDGNWSPLGHVLTCATRVGRSQWSPSSGWIPHNLTQIELKLAFEGLCCLLTPGLSKDIQCNLWLYFS